MTDTKIIKEQISDATATPAANKIPISDGAGTLSAWVSGISGTIIFVEDEGTPQGSAGTFNFVGANVEASVAAGVARIFITGSAGGGIPEAPLNTSVYGRSSGTWVPITGTYAPHYGIAGTYRVSGSNDITKNTATWQTMSGMSMNVSILGTLAKIVFETGVGNSSGTAVNRYRIAMDGVPISPEMRVKIPTPTVGIPVTIVVSVPVSPGSHLFEGQWYVESGIGQARGSPTGTYAEPRFMFVDDYIWIT